MRRVRVRVKPPPDPRPSRRVLRFTEAEKARAVRAIENGESWRVVAARYDVHTGTLTRWRRLLGNKTRPTYPTKIHTREAKLKAVARIRRGVSRETVAKAMKVHPETVKKWLQGLQLSSPNENGIGREMKLRAVAMLQAGWRIGDLAEELSVSEVSLRAWRAQFGDTVEAVTE